MEFTMSQTARSMMPTPSISTLYRAVAIMSLAGTALSASASGPEQAAKPFTDTQSKPHDHENLAIPKNQDKLNAQPVRSGRILAYANSKSSLISDLESLDNVDFVRVISSEFGVYELTAHSAALAESLEQDILSLPNVNFVRLDREAINDRTTTLQRRSQTARQTNSPATQWPGVTVLPSDTTNGRGVAVDPLQNSQWHFINNNGVPATAGRHNNIPDSIYTTDGIFGTGIQIGIANQGFNTHLDEDHTELDANYTRDLSMTFDPNRFADNVTITAIAGLIGAELDGSRVMGVAPNVQMGTFNWPLAPDSIPLQEFDAFDWLSRELDIRVYNSAFYYEDAVAAYNLGSIDSYVQNSLKNSYAFGRNRRGLINIFSTGINPNSFFDIAGVPAPAWPDPYFFPPAAGATWSPLDEVLDQALNSGGNASATTLTNDWVQGPYYPNGQIANYGPANDRRSFVFQTVAEDGFADIYSAQGPAVFASFYGGTTNFIQAQAAGQTLPLNALTTTVSDNVGFFPNNANAFPNSSETMSGAAIGAGVIALMLEINPGLSIRDIQHILFESIQESDRQGDGDTTWKWPNFDTTRTYLGNGGNSFWQANTGFYTGGPITEPQTIVHSDLYGFGVVDVEIALQKAASWQGTDRLIRLDTGLVGAVDGSSSDFEVEIPDAEILQLSEADGELGIDGQSIIGSGSTTLPRICVRQNIKIEAINVELTIEGNGNEDLFIRLDSPHGTTSLLKLPSTNNPFGTTLSDPGDPQDDDFDTALEVNINGTDFALFRHKFLSWKHWGELSGGNWSIQISDFGPDETQPEGEEATAGMDPTPGADNVMFYGLFGVPGSEFRSEKTVVAYRFEIFGTEIGAPLFEGCNPAETSCPGDMNGDGIVDAADLQIFIQLYLNGDAVADINEDGVLDYSDILLFRGLWQPGYCNGTGLGGGRPRPGDTNAGDDNNPSSRPI